MITSEGKQVDLAESLRVLKRRYEVRVGKLEEKLKAQEERFQREYE